MADARFPERWLSDRRIQRLTDAHFRAFITSLAWSVSNRTDGVIEPEDLGLIPNFAGGAVQAFVTAGLWSPIGTGWRITEFVPTQTSRSELDALEAVRAREREKKARQRAARGSTLTSTDTDVPGTVPGTCPGDVPPDYTGKARQGQARTGQDKQGDPQLKVVNGTPEWHGAGPNPYHEYN
jgi:hypothetical protein